MVKRKEKRDEQDNDEGEKKWEYFRLRGKFQIFIDIVIFLGCA